MAEAYIVDAVRTAVTRRGGDLSGAHPADLGAHPIRGLIQRVGLDGGAVDDVVLGCVDAIGTQAGDVARTSALVAGLPEEVPGATGDRQCGSSQQALQFAAQAVMSGTADLVIAGGVQNMSQYPIRRPVRDLARLGRSLRRHRDHPVPWSRDDGRSLGHHTRGDGGVRAGGTCSRV